MTDAATSRTTRAGTDAEHTLLRDRLQHVSWGAIFLGLVVAIGFQILLGLLGIGIGLVSVDPTDPAGSIGAWTIGTSIYVVVVQIISLFLGGYAAARLAPAITSQSAIFHGVSIWALTMIAAVWLSATTIGLAVSGVTSAVTGIGSMAGQAVQAVVPNNINLGVPQINFQDLPQPVQQTLRNNNITPQALQQELRSAYRQVVSQQEQQQIRQELQQAAQRILTSPGNAMQDIEKTINDIFGKQGVLSQQDMQEMKSILQNRLNLSEQDMNQIANQLQQTAQQAQQQAVQALQNAKQQSLQAAEAVASQVGKVALWVFVASLLGLIAAVFGGKKGEI
jgi:hypothetical protein